MPLILGTNAGLPYGTYTASGTLNSSALDTLLGETTSFPDADTIAGVYTPNSVNQRECVLVKNTSGSAITPGMALNFVAGQFAKQVQACPAGSAPRCFAPAYNNGSASTTFPNNSYFWAVKKGFTSALSDGTAIVSGGGLTIGGTTGEIRSSFYSGGSLLYNGVGPSTALSNTVTPTNFSLNYTIGANTLNIGDMISIRALVTMTGFNSTNTLACVLQVTPGTTGSAISVAGPTAYTGSANDIQLIEATLVIRTIGASGTFVGFGYEATGGPGAVGTSSTATMRPFELASSTIDTTQTQILAVQGTWSVANSGNSARCDAFTVNQTSSYLSGNSGIALAAAASGPAILFRADVNCQW